MADCCTLIEQFAHPLFTCVVMKNSAGIFLLLFSSFAFGQRLPDFSNIDWNVQFIDSGSTDSLAKKLTEPYRTELEKVRSIFSWITGHVSYDINIYNPGRRMSINYSDQADTLASWKSADEMVADQVMKRRVAVCDGYARLFKTLCIYSGIPCEVITGYARGDRSSSRFRSNHSWNAVFVDSSWHLIDVTWASGYIDYADDYVQKRDEMYFFPVPKQFARDHYPEDLKWTLMEHPPALPEFRSSPFRYKSFIKYGIKSYFPSSGILEAFAGDTLRFIVNTRDIERDKNIDADPFLDSAIFSGTINSVYVKPEKIKGNQMNYTYIVESPLIEWINIVYNDDIILRYKLNLRNNYAQLKR